MKNAIKSELIMADVMIMLVAACLVFVVVTPGRGPGFGMCNI